MSIKPTNIATAPYIKISLNIGGTFDIPTGIYIKGKHGEHILNGGLGWLTGFTGIGNNFKSTIMHDMNLSAMDKLVYAGKETHLQTYDTEINIQQTRLEQLARKFDSFKNGDIIGDGTWQVTDKTIYSGNKWYEDYRNYLEQKIKDAKGHSITTPFLDKQGNNIVTLTPTFGEVDSFSEFDTDDVLRMQTDNELGESGGNTMHMRAGLAKLRFLMEQPALSGRAYNFISLVSQLGKDIGMNTGPMPTAPDKRLGFLDPSTKLKGVTNKFTYLLHNFWHCKNAVPLMDADRKFPLYPKKGRDNIPDDKDLFRVSVQQLRSKNGGTGYLLDVLVSQTEGMLFSLTEFHYIKEYKDQKFNRFGLTGNMQNYHLDLYPDCNLSRTTARGKISDDKKLRRALNITSELCQMHEYWQYLHDTDPGFLCTAQELYDDIKKAGYDWDDILENTRGWWCPDNDSDKHPEKFLSTWDLLEIRRGNYIPYWKK